MYVRYELLLRIVSRFCSIFYIAACKCPITNQKYIHNIVLSSFIISTVNFEADNQSFKISKRDSSNLIEDLCSYEVRETVGATDHLLSLSTPLPKHSQLDPPTFTDNVEKSRNRREGDPLHWFGILVPSSLRDAQATSRLGIEEALPEMARMAIEMRRLESEIERLRKLTVKPK